MIYTTQSFPEGSISRPFMHERGTLSRHRITPYRHCRVVFSLLILYLYWGILVQGRKISTWSCLSGFGCYHRKEVILSRKEICDDRRHKFITNRITPFVSMLDYVCINVCLILITIMLFNMLSLCHVICKRYHLFYYLLTIWFSTSSLHYCYSWCCSVNSFWRRGRRVGLFIC